MNTVTLHTTLHTTLNIMNPYFIIIFGLIIGVFCLETLADFFNLQSLKKPLPKEFQDTYDSKKYATYLHYQSEGVQLECISRTIHVLLILSFIVAGGFNWVDLFAHSFHLGLVPTGLIFVGTLSVLSFLVHLPFSLWDTFVLEEKYGFNKTTPLTYCTDTLKGAVLGGILGGLVFSAVVYFFETSGPQAWLYSWIGLTVFQLALAYLAPVYIMPLFNRFSPLTSEVLQKAIQKYALNIGFQLQGIYTMDSSKRSTKSNAFFTGFGKFRRLVLFDTLIEKHQTEELVAIFAHEVGHFKRKHILKSMVISTISSGILFYTFGIFINNSKLFEAFQMIQVSTYASLVFIGLLYSPFLRLLSIFSQKLSRKYEFEADAFALETYGHPETLISALKKLSMDNLAHLTPHPLKVILDYSHPPILERIHAIRKSYSKA